MYKINTGWAIASLPQKEKGKRKKRKEITRAERKIVVIWM